MANEATSNWTEPAPEAAEFRSGLADSIDQSIANGSLPNLHAVVLARGGELLFERYYEGEDEAWGRPLGHVVFGPEVKHDVRSVTKSVVGLLYGIALEDGAVPELDAPLLPLFPELSDLAGDSLRDRMTVRDALSMRLGTEWNEDLPYSDPRNSEIAMEMAPERIRYVLGQPLSEQPGTQWRYNGGASAVLGRLIARGVGKDIRSYAEDRLLGPLGITDFDWTLGSDGTPTAASGLRMRARDLARIGRLVVNQGAWSGRRIVPQTWLARSFEPRAQVETDLHYGLHWWLYGKPDDILWAGAFGNGGQRLIAIPSTGLILVVFAGNYNKPDAWQVPVSVFVDHVLPAFAR